jgi:hypothetical protein
MVCLGFLLSLGPAAWADDPANDAAVTSAEAWLGLIDRGQFDASWDSAAPLFQQAISRDMWGATLKKVRLPLGDVVSRRVKSAEARTSLPGAPDGKYVVVQFETSFKNKQDAIETVTPMQGADGTWKISGYYIR